MGAEERPDEEPSQALVTGRPATIVYSGDWPPEQAPRGLFKRYEVRGRVCEVIPHILFLRKDDASAEFIHGHYKRAHATRDRFQRVVAAIRIEFDPPGEGDNLKDQEREELRSLERLGGAQSRIEGHGEDGELWLYIPQKRLDAHDPFGDTVADALVEGVIVNCTCVISTAPFINTIDIKRETPEEDALDIVDAPAPAPAEDDSDASSDSASYVQASPRDLALPSYMSGTVTKNGVDMY